LYELKLTKFVVGPLRTNVYLIELQEPRIILIDAGPGSFEKVIYYIDRYGQRLTYILLTHAHFDHISDAQFIREVTGAKIVMHSRDLELIELAESTSRIFGVRWKTMDIDLVLTSEEDIKIGELAIKPLHTPGHTPGSVCYYSREMKWIFTGDTLFHKAIGRTDLPGGSITKMYSSLRKILSLPKDVKVYPGHGPASTIGYEMRYNPYIKSMKLS